MKHINITSTNNEYIKNAIKLKDTKCIKQTNKTLVESIKIVKELNDKNYKFDYIFVTNNSLEKFGNILNNINTTIIVTTSAIINKLSSVVTSDEVVAIVNLPKKSTIFTNNSNFLVLDNIQDPTNMGAIIRSACAFNFVNLILINCTNPYTQKVTRCSMGYNFDVNFTFMSITEFLNLQMQNNLKLYCLNMQGENLYNINTNNTNFGLILGSEGQGVSKELLSCALNSVCIPMQNNVESLNASVSAGIVMSYFNNKK